MKKDGVGETFKGAETVDVHTALQMIQVGIVPTDEIDSVGTVLMLHGDIPVRTLGERTRAQFLKASLKLGPKAAENLSQCPEHFKFQAIEAVHGSNKQ